MRQGIGPLNRAWLTIIGIIALLAGLTSLLFASGLASQVGQALGLQAELAPPSQPVLSAEPETLIEPAGVAIGTAVVGVVLALLALSWLVKQVPRKNQARTLRLHADGSEGLTMCQPHVITDAVEGQIEAFPGVLKSGAVLRGTAASPELTVHAAVGDRADIREVVDYIHERTASDLETALEVPLRRLGIILDVSTAPKASKTLVL